MMNDEPFDYEHPVRCVHSSDEAIKVESKFKTFWVPKSVIHDDSEVYKVGDEGKLMVFTSFAESKKW